MSTLLLCLFASIGIATTSLVILPALAESVRTRLAFGQWLPKGAVRSILEFYVSRL